MSLLAEEINISGNTGDNTISGDIDEDATPIATPDISQGRKAQSSLDSLLDQEQSVSWNTNSNNSSTFSLSNRAKSNSLPKSAFGSLQLKGTYYFGLLVTTRLNIKKNIF